MCDGQNRQRPEWIAVLLELNCSGEGPNRFTNVFVI